MEDDFMKKYMKIMRDLAEAVDKSKEIEYEKRECAVNELLELYNDEGRTCYQLALLAIQITWWGEPAGFQDYGENVFALCQQMQDQEPNFDPDGPLAELIEHLQMEADEALAYVREQSDRVRRRSRAAKWGDSWVHRNLFKPRVLPRSRPILIKVRREPDPMDTDEDSDRSREGEDEVMDIDEYSEGVEDGEEEKKGGKYESSEAEDIRKSIEFDTPSNGSEDGSSDSTNSSDAHKMVLVSNKGDAIAEISDLESSVYIKAFIKYWNDDPAAWRKTIDMWEESHGHANRSKLDCIRGMTGEEPREIDGLPFRMSARGAHDTPTGSLESSRAL